jgi:hypothetical protein
LALVVLGLRLRRAQAQEQSGEVFELHHRYRDDEDDVQDQMNVAVCP